MKNSKTTVRILLFAGLLVALVLFAGMFDSSIYGNQVSRTFWLGQYENGPVKVVFIKAPPESERIVNARLILVETSGLVLRLPKESNKFFPYANIISVDPR